MFIQQTLGREIKSHGKSRVHPSHSSDWLALAFAEVLRSDIDVQNRSILTNGVACGG